MNNEGKFKKSLSDLVNSKQFEFDEANWEKASEMIDASRGAKGWKNSTMVVSCLLLIIAGVAGVYMLYPFTAPELMVTAKTEIHQPEISQTETRTTAMPQAKTVVVPSKKESKNAETTRNVVTQALAENHSPVPRLKQPATNIVSNEPISNTITKPISETISSEKTTTEHLLKSEDPRVKLSTTAKNPEAEPKTMVTVNTAPEKAQEELVPSLAVATGNSNVTQETHKASEPQPETKAEDETAMLTKTITPANTTEILNPVSIPQNQSSETKEEKTEVVALVQAPQNISPENSELSQKSSSEPPKGVGLYPLMPKADSSMLENDNATKLTYDIKEKPVLLSIEAGVSYLYGWKNPGKTDASGYNPFVGLNYFQAIHNKLSVSLGLQYTSVSNLNYSSHVTKVSQLGLGEESTVTVFTPTKIHYLLAPLRIHYRLNQKNIAGLGCNFAYLLTVESDVETYHQTLTSTDGHSIYKDKGYTQGFSPLDVQASAFYRHRLLSGLSINAEIFYGLIDTKDNTFFHSNTFERNTGLKISLVYNILKK